jgi:8-oxo-dGTP pyrophosphatase MutT (NUDIX family)
VRASRSASACQAERRTRSAVEQDLPTRRYTAIFDCHVEDTPGGDVMVKHATASVFLLAPAQTGWKLGLIEHPRFHRWMLPGGHVESWENPAEAALREVAEETGLDARLMGCPALSAPGNLGEPLVAPPLWIIEETVPAERREPSAHIHVDFLYAATASMSGRPVSGELRLGWFEPGQLPGLGLFENTRLLASALFGQLSVLTGGAHAVRRAQVPD